MAATFVVACHNGKWTSSQTDRPTQFYHHSNGERNSSTDENTTHKHKHKMFHNRTQKLLLSLSLSLLLTEMTTFPRDAPVIIQIILPPPPSQKGLSSMFAFYTKRKLFGFRFCLKATEELRSRQNSEMAWRLTSNRRGWFHFLFLQLLLRWLPNNVRVE